MPTPAIRDIQRNPFTSAYTASTPIEEEFTIALFLPGIYGFQLTERVDPNEIDQVLVYETSDPSNTFEVITSGTPNAGQVRIDIGTRGTSVCWFHSSNDGLTITVEYPGVGSNLNLTTITILINAIIGAITSTFASIKASLTAGMEVRANNDTVVAVFGITNTADASFARDLSIGRDLTVTRDLTVSDDLSVSGDAAVLQNLSVSGDISQDTGSTAELSDVTTHNLLVHGDFTPQGHYPMKGWNGVSRLYCSNNVSDTNNDVDISVGFCFDSDLEEIMSLDSVLTKRLDASWAVGTNQGGLDTGAKANSTKYYIYLIKRNDTGVVDALFSTSASSPTMPANYSKRRMIGFCVTDGSGNIRNWIRIGDEYLYLDPVLDVNISNLGTTATNYTLTLPAIANVIALINFVWSNANADTRGYIRNPGLTDVAATTAGYRNVANSVAAVANSYFGRVAMNSSAQIRATSQNANTSFIVGSAGYVWDRSI